MTAVRKFELRQFALLQQVDAYLPLYFPLLPTLIYDVTNSHIYVSIIDSEFLFSVRIFHELDSRKETEIGRTWFSSAYGYFLLPNVD